MSSKKKERKHIKDDLSVNLAIILRWLFFMDMKPPALSNKVSYALAWVFLGGSKDDPLPDGCID